MHRAFWVGVVCGFLLIACASADYKVYVLRYREGMLNGKTEKDDLPISVCDDTVQSKANCYVLLRSEYAKIMRDMIQKSRDLEACQKGR